MLLACIGDLDVVSRVINYGVVARSEAFQKLFNCLCGIAGKNTKAWFIFDRASYALNVYHAGHAPTKRNEKTVHVMSVFSFPVSRRSPLVTPISNILLSLCVTRDTVIATDCEDDRWLCFLRIRDGDVSLEKSIFYFFPFSHGIKIFIRGYQKISGI